MSVDYSIAQSIIQEYVYPTGNIFKVVTLGAHLNDGKYDKAINSQLGIIGNDYFHPDTIGTAPAEEKRVIDKWYPITLDKVKRLSFKSTCVGVLRETYRRSPSRVARIVNPLIGEEADDDWNFEVIPQGDIIAKINMYEKKRNIIPSSVLYEIDIPEYFKDFFAKEKIYTPNVFTPVAAYGPLVTDQGHGPPYQVEIHPAEQIWWTKQTPEIISHYLISASDASGSFKNRDDYDANNILSTDPTWKGIWQHVPQESKYAIPFFTGKKTKEVITINELTSFETSFGGIIPIGLEVEAYKAVKERNMKNLKYHLIHKKDTILQVNYIGSIAPTFQIDNFGYDPQSMLMYNDTVFKGFIIMSSQVKTYKGHQVHLVERINKDQHLEKPFTYTLDFDVIINSIKCDNIGDDTLINSSSRERSIELTGKIGIISQGIKQNIGANIPTISNNLIAEYKEPIILKKMESRRNLSNKKSLRIHENEEFFLRVAFNENVDFHKVIPMGGTNFIVKKEPSEQIEADGSTVKGATMFFYKIGEPNRFIIKAEGTHKTKITIEGSIIVKKKTKRLPVVKQGNAGL